jgi:hypothetical protein
MELTFTAQVWRMLKTTDAMGSKTEKYVALPGSIPCDVMPLADNLVFLQAGESEVSLFVAHFFAGADIRANDVIKILTTKKLSGLIGSYFEIVLRLEPTESISYIRCHAKAGVAPKQ